MPDPRPNRRVQRLARDLHRATGVPYQKALNEIRAGVPTPPAARADLDDGVTAWIKNQYFRGWEHTIAPGRDGWISDPGQHDGDGKRKYLKDGETPAGKPSYAIDDLLGLYLGTTLKVPMIVKVIALPEFDVEFVQENSVGRERDAGERWPWVTWVRGVLRVPLENAPDIDYLGIRGQITRGLPHFRITPDQYERLRKALEK
jgi:hypothetical protein